MPGGGVVHVPLRWLGEYVALPAGVSVEQIADAFVGVGLEVESITSGADGLSGPLVVGRVIEFVDEPQKNGKIIRWCQVDVGAHNTDDGRPRGIVCGAHNFAVDDLVVVSLPGAVLPGGFEIAARKTYGHVSDGMICSVRELGIGDDHDGILVLPPDSGVPGDDALDALGLREPVIELAVTPDRGYCLSLRGLARELAGALDVAYTDVADTVRVPDPDAGVHEVIIDDPVGCPVFSMRAVTGLDPHAPSPTWMQDRLRQAHVRPISLAVDVTNYVMLETGQPLHAFSHSAVRGPVVIRRARAGERLTTLDGKDRALDPGDLLVTDDSGPIALAGVMGGASTEIEDDTTDVLLEAATWEPAAIAGAVRRHRLPSEAAKRFERGVDPAVAAVALQRCVDLLVEHGDAHAVAGFTVAGGAAAPARIALAVSHPAALIGMPIDREAVVARLLEVGCTVDGIDVLQVQPPTWRPDLVDAAGLIEEIARLEGYASIPSELPTPPPGRGLTEGQKQRQAVSRALAESGYTEVLSWPFAAVTINEVLGVPADDLRRATLRLANPLSDEEPDLRTSLLPGLLATARRNVGRGLRDLALYEIGLVYRARAGAEPGTAPGTSSRPSDAELAALDAGVPDQPRLLAVALTGDLRPKGWTGPARPATWADAIEAARVVARTVRADLIVRQADVAPWHPGRCAELLIGDTVIGHAGELHPRVVAALELPPRTCVAELDLDALPVPTPARGPQISPFPPVLLDVALTVAADRPAAAVEAALRAGAGPLLESIRLFDVYVDDALRADGRRSLAYALRLRAPDRTLTTDEATAARDAAVARAVADTGAELRG